MSSHSAAPRPAIPSREELAKLPPDGGEGWNRLVFEQSPYLLQHAANPVDWYPWGDEAFARARELGRPVFLSIGYSTCHWCHVMEHESFEDAAVAKALNDTFVCIKVDREERPDIDHVYMTVTQALTGHGGWPMTVVMTPDRKPFFAGTYFPKEGRYGRPGIYDVVRHIDNLWKNDRDKAVEAAEYISAELGRIGGSMPGGALSAETLDRAFELYRGNFDGSRGGFGDRPKFPTPHNLSFLVRYHLRTGNPEARQMVEKTLHEMRLGGIFDQVGFGFHRYSTDSDWLVPHFEKMLYDQALMAIACIEAWQVFGTPELLRTAEEIFTYVRRDMTSPEGAFYSAEDADSEGEEGRFYVWSVEEVREVLGAEEGEFFADLFRFEPKGNFREEATGELLGTNIPHLSRDLDSEALRRKLEPEAFRRRVDAARAKLFERRRTRIHPLKDDKVLTDWNGLMIAAFAKAAKATGNPEHLAAARRAADFALATLRAPDGRLLKRARGGQAGLPAHLEDYAFLAWGLLELYEAAFDERYLMAALDLAAAMLERFHDPDGKGFFHTASDAEKLIVRSKDVYDGAIPSGNSVAALVLLRLGRMTSNPALEAAAHETIEAFSAAVARGPINHAQMLIALDFALSEGREVILGGPAGDGTVEAMAEAVRRGFAPGTVLVRRPAEDNSELLRRVPALEPNRASVATAWVCRGFACEKPVTDIASLEAMLAAKNR